MTQSIQYLPGQTLKLNVVVESGHKNAGSGRVIFEQIKGELRNISVDFDVLGTLTYAVKDGCDELMLPDFISHMALMANRLRRDGSMPPIELTPLSRPDSSPRDITHLEFKANGGLAGLRDVLGGELEKRRSAPRSTPLRPDATG